MKKRIISSFLSLIMVISTFMTVLSCSVSASNTEISISGNEYTFGEKSDYLISEATSNRQLDNSSGYGKLLIKGDVVEGEKKGIKSYAVSSGNLKICYQYRDDMLIATGEKLHLISDGGNKVNGEKISGKIKKGLIWLQISRDKTNWITVKQITNAFENTPIETDALYETNDIELINGCYYRLTVAYKTEQQTGTKKGLFGKEKAVYEYKKKLEIYEFYAYNPESVGVNHEGEATYRLGAKERVEHEGYYKTKEIDNKDVHFGWDIGDFFISGYTGNDKDENGNDVFLKNVGDKVILWFKLTQNIDKLNDNSRLSVLYDDAGYDKNLETPKTELGRGALIIRKTDHQNKKQDPVIYINYLEANTSLGADTMVQLFEEGDYEVSLNYGITNDKFIDQSSYYKIAFKFSIRNGNCPVHLFDLGTGGEILNTAFTLNGFRIDLAGSKYLKVNVKKEIYTNGSDGLVEDTSFNHVSNDGKEYTDEGIYTITVINKYVNEPTVKKIYVGNNSIVKAHIATNMAISEIKQLVSTGAVINDDGTITIGNQTVATVTEPETEPIMDPITTEKQADPETEDTVKKDNDEKSTSKAITVLIIIVATLAVVIVVGVVAALIVVNRSKKNKKQGNEGVQKQ